MGCVSPAAGQRPPPPLVGIPAAGPLEQLGGAVPIAGQLLRGRSGGDQPRHPVPPLQLAGLGGGGCEGVLGRRQLPAQQSRAAEALQKDQSPLRQPKADLAFPAAAVVLLGPPVVAQGEQHIAQVELQVGGRPRPGARAQQAQRGLIGRRRPLQLLLVAPAQMALLVQPPQRLVGEGVLGVERQRSFDGRPRLMEMRRWPDVGQRQSLQVPGQRVARSAPAPGAGLGQGLALLAGLGPQIQQPALGLDVARILGDQRAVSGDGHAELAPGGQLLGVHPGQPADQRPGPPPRFTRAGPQLQQRHRLVDGGGQIAIPLGQPSQLQPTGGHQVGRSGRFRGQAVEGPAGRRPALGRQMAAAHRQAHHRRQGLQRRPAGGQRLDPPQRGCRRVRGRRRSGGV